jgi:hypothetical protein
MVSALNSYGHKKELPELNKVKGEGEREEFQITRSAKQTASVV